MDRRVWMVLLGIVALGAIMLLITQSQNLSQTQATLVAAHQSSTAQAGALFDQLTAANQTALAAATEAVATRKQALQDAGDQAATSQAQMVNQAQATATQGAQDLLSTATQAVSQAGATATQGARDMLTAAAQALEDTHNQAATAQAQAVDQAQATSTEDAAHWIATSTQAVANLRNQHATAQAELLEQASERAAAQNATVTAQAASLAEAENNLSTQIAEATISTNALQEIISTLGAQLPTQSPPPTSAVSNPADLHLLWDLDGLFTVTDLGFQFNYPFDWVVDTSAGIKIAETDTDLSAIMDADDSTQPQGYTIMLGAALQQDLGLSADSTLDDTVNYLVELLDITESESRVTVPVMTYRAIVVIGTNKADSPELLTIWQQDGYVVVFSLSLKDNSPIEGYSWGVLLGQMQPVGALELGEEPLTAPDGDFTMRYPKGWFTGGSANYGSVTAAEIQRELGGKTSDYKGDYLAVTEQNLSNFGENVTDLDSLIEFFKNSQGHDAEHPITSSEHIILEQPAITLSGLSALNSQTWFEMTFLIRNDKVIIIGVIYPSEDRFNEFKPTYLAMLQSITAAAT